MDHTFFILEGKSNRGHLGKAKNQARRGGAVLVSAHRILHKTASELDVNAPGADASSIVFSAVMNADLLILYPRWAEVRGDGGVVYHMTSFSHTTLGSVRQLPALRKAVNNIKQRAAIDGMPELIKLREKLHVVPAKRLKERDDGATDTVAKSKSSSLERSRPSSSP